MQQYTKLQPTTNISDTPNVVNATTDTLLSSSAGATFPSSNNLEGRLCFRSDMKKLYCLTDYDANTWQMIIDFNKTPVDAETIAATYVPLSYRTSSLTDGSSSKVATAAATKELKSQIDTRYLEFTNFKTGITQTTDKFTFNYQLEISRNLPVMRLKSASVGSNTVEKAAALLMGPADSTSLTMSVRGDGTGYIGVGGLDVKNSPVYKAIRINPAQQGVHLYGVLTTATSVSVGGSMTIAGDVVAQGDVTAYSDESVKTNIQTIEHALSKVMSMRGVMYERKSDNAKKIGLIAQEVEKVVPEAVVKSGDMKSLAYGNLVGLLIEAVKELNEKVNRYAAV